MFISLGGLDIKFRNIQQKQAHLEKNLFFKFYFIFLIIGEPEHKWNIFFWNKGNVNNRFFVFNEYLIF